MQPFTGQNNMRTFFDDLIAHQQTVADRPILNLFENNNRAASFSAEFDGFLFDYSKTNIDETARDLLLNLLETRDVAGKRAAMFSGETINETEGRAVLHTALRNRSDRPVLVDGRDVMPDVNGVLDAMGRFADGIRSGDMKGATGKAITDVVNIGIGGSDLGPRMAADALAHLASDAVRVHYVSNPDAWALWSVLRGLDAQRTLFIVSSKTFTTQETLTNAASAQRWLTDHGCPANALAQHLVAITASPATAARLGYPAERTFLFWDWVGGRYSVWSAIGLPLAIALMAFFTLPCPVAARRSRDGLLARGRLWKGTAWPRKN